MVPWKPGAGKLMPSPDRQIEEAFEKQYDGQEECDCGAWFEEGGQCPWCGEVECEACLEPFVPRDEYPPEALAPMKEPPKVCMACALAAAPEAKECFQCGRYVPPDSEVDLCEFCIKESDDD